MNTIPKEGGTRPRVFPVRFFARALYAAGTLVVLVLAVVAALRVPAVPFPAAMLPMTLGELATVWLALGTLPMAAAAWLLRRYGEVRGRYACLVWLPAVTCAACLAYWAAVVCIALGKFLFEAIVQ